MRKEHQKSSKINYSVTTSKKIVLYQLIFLVFRVVSKAGSPKAAVIRKRSLFRSFFLEKFFRRFFLKKLRNVEGGEDGRRGLAGGQVADPKVEVDDLKKAKIYLN